MLQDLIEASYEQHVVQFERRLQIPITDYQEVVLGGKFISLEKLLSMNRITVLNWYTVGVVQMVEKNSFELSDMKGLSIKCINHTEAIQEGNVVALDNPIWRQNLMIKNKGSIHFIGRTDAIRCRQCKRLTSDVLCAVHLRESIQHHKNDRQNIKTSSSIYQLEKKEFKKPEILDKSSEQFFEYIAQKNDRVSKIIKKQTTLKVTKDFNNPLIKHTAFYKNKELQKSKRKPVSSDDELEIDFTE